MLVMYHTSILWYQCEHMLLSFKFPTLYSLIYKRLSNKIYALFVHNTGKRTKVLGYNDECDRMIKLVISISWAASYTPKAWL